MVKTSQTTSPQCEIHAGHAVLPAYKIWGPVWTLPVVWAACIIAHFSNAIQNQLTQDNLQHFLGYANPSQCC